MWSRNISFLALAALFAIGSASNQFVADSCVPEDCIAPNCRCSSTVLDASIPLASTPQLVQIVFNDGATTENLPYVNELLEDRVNPDGCTVSATFYITHEYTDYSTVHKLWAEGHEIGLRSITNEASVQYWRGGDVDLFIEEFGGQRQLVSNFANIPASDITGMRVPMFELAANNSYLALVELGLLYDNSWPTQSFISPALWPYTLDFQSTQDCPLGNCPDGSIPGAWVAPVLNWEDLDGFKCISLDACQTIPADEDGLVDWMISNFNNTYQTNKAPFSINLNAAWFRVDPIYYTAFTRFMNYMDEIEDVYFVSVARSIEYTRNPQPIGGSVETTTYPTTLEPTTTTEGEIFTTVEPTTTDVSFARNGLRTQIFEECEAERVVACQPRLCELIKEATNEIRWMTICNVVCPAVYPWLNNPLGTVTP